MNYTELADNDPGGDLDTAFAAMSSETVVSDVIYMVTDRLLARELGLSTAMGILGGLQAAIDAGAIPARVMSWLESDGIDVNHAETKSAIDSMTPTFLTVDQANALKALGRQSKYQGLTKSSLEKARRLRAEGKA